MSSAFITDYHISTEERVFDQREICSCCGLNSFPIHRPLAFNWSGKIVNPRFCSECMEEFENGNNPLFKQTKEESL